MTQTPAATAQTAPAEPTRWVPPTAADPVVAWSDPSLAFDRPVHLPEAGAPTSDGTVSRPITGTEPRLAGSAITDRIEELQGLIEDAGPGDDVDDECDELRELTDAGRGFGMRNMSEATLVNIDHVTDEVVFGEHRTVDVRGHAFLVV